MGPRQGQKGIAPFERSGWRGPSRIAAISALVIAFVMIPLLLTRSIITLDVEAGLALLGLLLAAILVAFPRGDRAVNARLIVWALAAYLAFDILWADYVAVSLPFIPFITPVRIYLFVLLGGWLFLAATSRSVHLQTWKSAQAVPLVTVALWLLFAFEVASLLVPGHPAASKKVLVNQLLSYLVPFLIALGFVRSRTDVAILVRTLVFCAGLVGLIAIAESIAQRNLYGGFFGKWLNYDADWLRGVWFGDFRYGKYRAFGPFFVHLSLGEFFVLAMPFVIYCAETAKRIWTRVLFWSIAALSMAGILATDSRTALVTSLGISAIYLLFKGVAFAIERRASIFRPLVVLAIVFSVAAIPIGGAFMFKRIGWQNAFGEGGTRSTQLVLGIPKVAKRPVFGYGVGTAGYVLEYRSDGRNLTIDNYYLSVALDSGLPAMFAFAMLPLAMIYIGFRRAARRTPDAPLFLAFALSALGFALTRSTLSQAENINFFYILLGTFVALVALIRDENAAEPGVERVKQRRRVAAGVQLFRY